MERSGKIYLAGHNGMVGAAISSRLRSAGFVNILTATHKELDLANQADVRDFFQKERPDTVVVAAAHVGGILANNNYPADFIYDNLMIAANVVEAAHRNDVDQLLFLGSSCIYPRDAVQPIKETELLGGPLEPTNEPYAVAKIAGIKLCESYNRQHGRHYRALMPTNLYGPNDNFDLETSHVIPALLRKIHEAKQRKSQTVEVWGSGTPCREFMHVDDLADACLFIMQQDDSTIDNHVAVRASHINVGYGEDISIKDLATLISEVVGFEGQLEFDASKPDGMPRKLLDNGLMSSLGWQPKIHLRVGLSEVYSWYQENGEQLRGL